MRARRAQKRREAVERMIAYTYENSKAKRLGTRTREQWEKARTAEVARLTS